MQGSTKWTFSKCDKKEQGTDAGSSYFMFFEFLMLRRAEIGHFKNWTLPKTVSLLKSTKRVKIFEKLQCTKKQKIFLNKLEVAASVGKTITTSSID